MCADGWWTHPELPTALTQRSLLVSVRRKEETLPHEIADEDADIIDLVNHEDEGVPSGVQLELPLTVSPDEHK